MRGSLTDETFPGNPTKSYRSLAPLRVVDELRAWTGHTPEEIAAMRAVIVGREPEDD